MSRGRDGLGPKCPVTENNIFSILKDDIDIGLNRQCQHCIRIRKYVIYSVTNVSIVYVWEITVAVIDTYISTITV